MNLIDFNDKFIIIDENISKINLIDFTDDFIIDELNSRLGTT